MIPAPIPAPQMSEDPAGGYCLVLCVYADGTAAVSRHPLPEEEQEQGQPGVTPEQRYPDPGTAIRAMAEMVTGGGEEQAEAQFAAGYNED